MPIWSIKQELKSKPIGSFPGILDVHRASYLISLKEKGSVISMEWNPFVTANNLIIGILMVIFGNGSCEIYLIPQESFIDVELKSNSFLSLPVVEERHLKMFEIPQDDLKVTAASWNPHSKDEIYAGYSDGSITIFDIRSSMESG